MSQQYFKKYFKKLTATLFCTALAACGGGGGGGSEPQSFTCTSGNNSITCTEGSGGTSTPGVGSGTTPPNNTVGTPPASGSVITPPSAGSGSAPPSSGSGSIPPSSGSGSSGGNTGSGSTPPSSGSGSSGGNTESGSTPPSSGSGNSGSTTGSPIATPPSINFAARVTQAPADGATISGTIRILVEGSGIRNVELLPSTGYAPLIARGTVTGDNIGAYIDLDTRVLPEGPITLRVAAFNALPGQGGSEITAMAARTWTVQNTVTPTFSAQLVSAPPIQDWLGRQPDGTFADTVRFEVSGANLGNVELISAKDESVIYGRFTISPDRTRATLDWNYWAYNGWAYSAYEVRVVAWNVPPGGSGDRIEVMAPRRYLNLLPRGCQGEGTCGGEAP